MEFKTLSALLRGTWLLEPSFAKAHLPIVSNVLSGKGQFDFKQKQLEDLQYNFKLANSFTAATVGIGSNYTNLPTGTVAIVNMFGPFLKYGDECSYGVMDKVNLINALATASNISAVVIDLDSPGGQADGTSAFATAIKNCAAIKPVIGLVNDGMAASAGMWAISACTEIYCTHSTDQFGSIGVYTTIADWNAYMAEQGLIVKEIYAPQSTDKNKTYYDALAGDESGIKADLKILADNFINAIAENRKGKIQGKDWATGKMYYAQDAIALGLIDGIKEYKQVLQRAAELSQSTTTTNNPQNTNNMAFETVMTTVGATEIPVTDAGFVLDEQQLTALENSLTELNTLQANHVELEAASDANVATIADLRNQLATATTSLEAANALVAEYGAKTATAADTTKSEDDFDTKEIKEDSFDLFAKSVGL